MSARCKTVSAIGVVLLLCSAVSAEAACNAEISNTGLSQETAYDPFGAGEVLLTREIRIRSTGDPDCAFWLSFHRNPSTGATLGGSIGYEVQNTGGSSLLSSQPAGDQPTMFLASSSLAADAEALLSYRWFIPRGQSATPGAYGDSIELRLFEASTSNTVDTKTLQLTATVGSTLSINLAGADVTSPYNHSMDFGALAQGAHRTIEIGVRSNQSYRLSFESAKAGVLGLDGSGNWTVPYEATLAGSPLVLTSSTTAGPFSPTDASGTNRQFRVTIGEVTGRRAGTYSDEITIRVEVAP